MPHFLKENGSNESRKSFCRQKPLRGRGREGKTFPLKSERSV